MVKQWLITFVYEPFYRSSATMATLAFIFTYSKSTPSIEVFMIFKRFHLRETGKCMFLSFMRTKTTTTAATETVTCWFGITPGPEKRHLQSPHSPICFPRYWVEPLPNKNTSYSYHLSRWIRLQFFLSESPIHAFWFNLANWDLHECVQHARSRFPFLIQFLPSELRLFRKSPSATRHVLFSWNNLKHLLSNDLHPS